MYVEQNCFERDTQILKKHEIYLQIMRIYQISLAMSKSQYQNALAQLNDFLQTTNEEDDLLTNQLKLVEIYCCFQLDKFQKVQEIGREIYEILKNQEHRNLSMRNSQSQRSFNYSRSNLEQQLMRSFSIRFYVFLITVMIKGIKTDFDSKDILNRLTRILKVDKYIYLPHVLGTITGCRNFRNVKRLKVVKGEDTFKKAMKLQVLSIWKFMVDEYEDGVRFKEQALSIWKRQNKLNEKQKCEKQLKELRQYIPSQKLKGVYIKKLQTIKYFVKDLIQLQNQTSMPSKNGDIKLNFPSLLKDIYQQEQDKKSVDKNGLSYSKFQKINDKKNELINVIQKCKEFYILYKRQKYNSITNLILNSKFIDENTKYVRSNLNKFNTKIRKVFLQIAFIEVKNFTSKRSKKGLNK